MTKKQPVTKPRLTASQRRSPAKASTGTGKASGTRASKPETKPKPKPAAKRKPRPSPPAPLPGVPGRGEMDCGRVAPQLGSESRSGSATFVVTRQADVATFCGVSLDTVKGWAKQGMPGKPPSYDLAEIVQWLRREGPWKPGRRTPGMTPQGSPDVGDDILLEGGAGSSPALEKLRAAKAALAELDLQERRGALISVERSKDVGLWWADLIKRMGERLGKRYGRDATDTVNRTLEECRRVLEAGYARPEDADSDAVVVDCEREAASHEADG